MSRELLYEAFGKENIENLYERLAIEVGMKFTMSMAQLSLENPTKHIDTPEIAIKISEASNEVFIEILTEEFRRNHEQAADAMRNMYGVKKDE